MRKLFFNFPLGLLFGFILTMWYYDGVVARDYKESIRKYQKALDEANSFLIQKIEENDLLKRYLIERFGKEQSNIKSI